MSTAVVANKKISTGLLVAGYIFSALGGLLGLWIGSHVWRGKIRTSSGDKEFKYDASSRRHGKAMFLVAAGVMILGLVVQVIGGPT